VVATGPNNIKEWQAISIKGKYLNQKVWNIDTELSETIGEITTVSSLPSANVGDLVYSSENRVLGYVSDTIFGEKEVITAVYVPPPGKVRSSDGTVAVVENEYNFDLSIQSEINARRQADSALQANINTEVAARLAADKALGGRVDAEAQVRQQTDSALQGAIYAEAAARAAADSTLQGAIDSEAARATGRENKIEANARRIDVNDNENGTFTFTNYDNISKTVQSGKKVQSSDGTVAVAENTDNFDLSIQSEISRVNTLLDKSVEADTIILSDEDSVSISTDSKNLLTNATSNNTIDLPTASISSAGVMDSTMFSQFVKNTTDIEELFAWVQGQGRVVIAHLGGTFSQTAITGAFNLVYPGAIQDKDTVIDIDNEGYEWMYSNGIWVNLSTQRLPLASTEESGMASDNNVDGGVTYQVPGKGQLVGWSDLKARVAAAEGNISGLQTSNNQEYVYGMSVSGNVLTYNLKNISTGATRAATVDLPNAFTNVSYSGNTFKFTKADGTTQTQAITLAASNVSGLATVATTGSYSDLTDKPAIPAVNNATLTIQRNGANVQTFTANQGTNATANITVPATDNTAPGALTSGGTGAAGTSDLYARRDHTHTLPAYPAVGSGTLSLKVNGTTQTTFSANASGNAEFNVDTSDGYAYGLSPANDTIYYRIFDRTFNSQSGGLLGIIVNAAGYAGKAEYSQVAQGHRFFNMSLYQQGNNIFTASKFTEIWQDDVSTWSIFFYLLEGVNTPSCRLRIWARTSVHGDWLYIKFFTKYDYGGWLDAPVNDGNTQPAGSTHFTAMTPIQRGDPMQLAKGDGSLTSGYGTLVAPGTGIFANIPALPSASGSGDYRPSHYFALFEPNMLKVMLIGFMTCPGEPRMFTLITTRPNTSSNYAAGTWREMLTPSSSKISEMDNSISNLRSNIGSLQSAPAEITPSVTRGTSVSELNQNVIRYGHSAPYLAEWHIAFGTTANIASGTAILTLGAYKPKWFVQGLIFNSATGATYPCYLDTDGGLKLFMALPLNNVSNGYRASFWYFRQ
jgi:hypothetical protein